MDNFNLVVFGITSNLAQVKLIPSLFDLYLNGKIDGNCKIFGLFKHERSDDELKKMLVDSITAKKGAIVSDIGDFLSMFCFVQCDFSEPDSYLLLKEKLCHSGDCNRVYYLATHPKLYEDIFHNLERSGLNATDRGWVRVMIEKPIGRDLKTSDKLNEIINRYYNDDQVFRIDHYLGKETIQNILTFRFNNPIFKDMLNKNNIDHIQVIISENFGVDTRSGYFDDTGNLSDIGQNHLLQMLAFATMDSPDIKSRFDIIDNLIPIPNSLVLGSYDDYDKTDTFFAFKAIIGSGNFEGVPVYMRGGKKLAKTVAEVSIVFRTNDRKVNNVLTYRIQPNEGIILKILVKKPGEKTKLQTGLMQFCFKQLSEKLSGPYEYLILDAINGDQTLFNNAAEIHSQWKFIDKLKSTNPPLLPYKNGTWGPEKANEMIASDKREWIEPEDSYCNI